MPPQEPQIFDLDPDKAPRRMAIILLTCGLLGVGFVLINSVFTGADPYYIEKEWDEGDEPVNQRYDIIPNLVRGRQPSDDSEEDQEARTIPVKKPAKKPASTNPLENPFKLLRPASPFAPATTGAAAGGEVCAKTPATQAATATAINM